MAASALAAMAAHAQEWPQRPVRIIVPFAAGASPDILARIVNDRLSARIGQPLVVENRPGAGGNTGTDQASKATPDGYTFLLSVNAPLVYNTILYKNLPYDPFKDLAPVSLMGRFPMILVVSPSVTAKDAKAFIAEVKANPAGINYASAGAGSPHHLAMELLKTEAGLKMTHAPYRGAAPALADVAGGQVPAMMVDMAAGAGFIKGGKVRPLAVANATRLPQLPDVPTFAELGYKNVEAAALVGMVAPAATPKDVIASLNKQVVAAINAPDVHKKLVDFGVEPVGSSPEQFAELLKSETARWHKLIRDLGITLD